MDWTAEDYNASKIAHSNKAAAEIIAQATVRAAKINARTSNPSSPTRSPLRLQMRRRSFDV